MPSALSIKLGDLLYKHAFPVYNIIYPVFKRRQDKDEIALLKQYIKPGDTVLDIGANIGFYTRILSELVGETGKVYAFEPDTTNFRYLQQNARQLKNAALYNQAVSDHTGSITLYRSTMLNVDHKTYASDAYSEKYEIPCISPDELLEGKPVQFIKIDIQGYEYFAFRGMRRILQENPGLRILSEFFPYGIKKSGVSLRDFLDLFTGSGFTVSLIEDGQFRAITHAELPAFENMDQDQYFNIFITR